MDNVGRCPHCGSIIDWVGSTAAARTIGVSERRVRQLVEADRFPGAKRDENGWRIPLASIAAFIEAREASR